MGNKETVTVLGIEGTNVKIMYRGEPYATPIQAAPLLHIIWEGESFNLADAIELPPHHLGSYEHVLFFRAIVRGNGMLDILNVVKEATLNRSANLDESLLYGETLEERFVDVSALYESSTDDIGLAADELTTKLYGLFPAVTLIPTFITDLGTNDWVYYG